MRLFGRLVRWRERFRWNAEKNVWLQEKRGVAFEKIIAEGTVLDDLKHPNEEHYPRQRLLIISLNEYAYVVPYTQENDTYFLKTIYPSRTMTKKYLGQGGD